MRNSWFEIIHTTVISIALVAAFVVIGIPVKFAIHGTNANNFVFKEPVLVHFVDMNQQILVSTLHVDSRYFTFTTTTKDKITYVGDFYFVEYSKKSRHK